MPKERAERAAIEETAKRIAFLKQRADRAVLKRRAEKASLKQRLHLLVSVENPVPVILNCHRRHFYSSRLSSLYESHIVRMYHVFLSSPFLNFEQSDGYFHLNIIISPLMKLSTLLTCHRK